MSFARQSLLAAAVCLSVAPSGCRKDTSPPVAVVDDDAAQSEPGTAPEQPQAIAKKVDPNAKPMRIRASARELSDILEFIRTATATWAPETAVNPEAQIQAMLLQFGYGPGLWSNLNLDGVMAVEAEFPPPGSHMVVNNRLVGSLATVNASKLIEAVPMTHRPQPLGNGLYEWVGDDVRLLFREQAASLEFGLDMASLDAANALAQSSTSGPRVSMTAWDFPTEDISLSRLLELPRNLQLSRTLDEIAAGMKSASFGFDAGLKRDIQLTVSAEAEFGRLGLGPLGSPRTSATKIEQHLPGGAVSVLAMPWGSPEMLHKTLDRAVPIEQVPAPFDAMARDAMTAVHQILDGIRDDVLFAMYLSPRGEATIVLAAGVSDEAAARAGIRGIADTITRAVQAYSALSGGQADASFKTTWKPEAARLPRGKADLLTVTFPKNMQRELESAAPFLRKKNNLDVYLHVDGELAVVAFGGGAKKFLSQLGKTPKDSLASDAGLALARQSSGGCHFCLSVDPLASIRMFLTFARLDPSDTSKDERKRIDQALKSLAKVELEGGAGAGLRLDAKEGAFGMGLSHTMVVPPKATVDKLMGIIEKLEKRPETTKKPLKKAK